MTEVFYYECRSVCECLVHILVLIKCRSYPPVVTLLEFLFVDSIVDVFVCVFSLFCIISRPVIIKTIAFCSLPDRSSKFHALEFCEENF